VCKFNEKKIMNRLLEGLLAKTFVDMAEVREIEDEINVLLEDGLYANKRFFEEHKDRFKKHKAVFIDEAQDYKKEWLDIIKTYFLEEEGREYALFGDVKQNIYGKSTENKNFVSNINRKFTTLTGSYRSTHRIKNLLLGFQKNFFANKYDIDSPIDLHGHPMIDFRKDSVNYFLLPDEETIPILYRTIRNDILNGRKHPNDITLLGDSLSFLRKFDSYYRHASNEKTNTTFETSEILYKIGMNRFGKDPKFRPFLQGFRETIGRGGDVDEEKGERQMCTLLVLYDLWKDYPDLFSQKLEIFCKRYGTTIDRLSFFLDQEKEGMSSFKEACSSAKLHLSLKEVRIFKKRHFLLDRGCVKISTLHSFKGLECANLFLIT